MLKILIPELIPVDLNKLWNIWVVEL